MQPPAGAYGHPPPPHGQPMMPNAGPPPHAGAPGPAAPHAPRPMMPGAGPPPAMHPQTRPPTTAGAPPAHVAPPPGARPFGVPGAPPAGVGGPVAPVAPPTAQMARMAVAPAAAGAVHAPAPPRAPGAPGPPPTAMGAPPLANGGPPRGPIAMVPGAPPPAGAGAGAFPAPNGPPRGAAMAMPPGARPPPAMVAPPPAMGAPPPAMGAPPVPMGAHANGGGPPRPGVPGPPPFAPNGATMAPPRGPHGPAGPAGVGIGLAPNAPGPAGYAPPGPPGPQPGPPGPPPGPPQGGYPPPANGNGYRPGGFAPPAPPGPSAPRIDPAQIPRPPHDSHAEITRHETRSQTGHATHPPPANSSFSAKDLGSCNPRYMRSTMSTIPNSGDLLNSSGMPLTILVQPLAVPHPDEEPIHVVDNGAVGPVRCGRCKAYMNPFARFLDHSRFQCNFCSHVTEVPRDYMCNLGADGRRQDWTERPELCRGSVEYVAPAEYMVRPPMAPALFFCVDVNPAAVQSGATTSACEAIARTLDSVPEPARTLVGICTFDSCAHFYKLTGSSPQMLVVPDAEEPYSPLPAGLAVPLEAHRDAVDAVLKQIPEMFATNRHGAPAGTAAIKACVEALKPVGGRVLAFVGTMPTGGYGGLKNRAAPVGGGGGGSVGGGGSFGGASKEADKEPARYLAPADKAYAKMATEAAEYQVAIDLFLLADGYVDVASLGSLPRITGGSLYRYPSYNVQLDFAQLHNDLRWNVLRPQGLEAVMRLRASAGLGVVDYDGFYCKRTPTDVDLPAVDCDKAIAVTLRHEEKLADGGEACVQCALLYTTVAGERRIRVHTLALPVSSVLGNIFRASDLEAQTCDLIRRSAAKLLAGNASLASAREAALNTTVNTLYAYRKFCASNNSTGQLILPEGLKVLPLYCLALHKSDGLRSDASADDRAAWLLRGACGGAATAVPSVYPRNFPVHDLSTSTRKGGAEGGGEGGGEGSAPASFPPLPPVTWLSAEKLEQDGMYLLEDGREMLLWVGRQTDAATLRATLGVDHVDQIHANATSVPQLDTPQSAAMCAFVNCMRKMRSSYMRTRVIKRGDPAENAFYRRLVEDRSAAGMSYVEFLCHVHRLIQNKFQ